MEVRKLSEGECSVIGSSSSYLETERVRVGLELGEDVLAWRGEE